MTDTLATAPASEPASAPAPAAAAGGTAAPAPADAGGGAPVTPAAGAAATSTTPPAATPASADTTATGTAGATPTPPAGTTPPAGETLPENWRAAFAQGDADFEKKLSRYASPVDFFKAHKSLEAKMSSGELKRAAPNADATPEDVAAWRAEAGIPETAEGYFEKIELPTGVTLGEADKPFANTFAEYAHKENMTPKQVSAAMAWYYDTVDKQTMAHEEADATFKVSARDALHSEWRGDFKANMNAAQAVIRSAPQEVQERLFGGRTADGKLIGNDPAVLKFFANLGRELNPAATLLPPGVPQNTASVDTEIKAIQSKMGTPEYWKDEALQERYRLLVSSREKMQG